MGRPPTKERYRIDPTTGCWLWLLGCDSGGYGQVHIGRKSFMAHRFYYEKYIGEVPKGRQLDHLCRVRRCVNPWHLEPVTNAQNVQRSRKAKLTMDKARELRRRYQAGEPYRKLAEEFQVNRETVWKVVSNQSWVEV